MLPAKYQPNPPGGSGEEDFLRVFVSPAKQKRDICTAFPASMSSSSSSSAA